jgi:hypothetical protein
MLEKARVDLLFGLHPLRLFSVSSACVTLRGVRLIRSSPAFDVCLDVLLSEFQFHPAAGSWKLTLVNLTCSAVLDDDVFGGAR